MTDLTLAARMESSVLHHQLLAGAKLVGGVFHLDFHSALVSTDDKWKSDAGGVPQHSFLLATVMPLDEPGEPDDEEVILLRVDNTCALPRAAEATEVREFMMRQTLTDVNLTVDALTQQEMQRSGFECRILGTFYQTDLPGGRSLLDFGADIDNVYAASRYRVYKPSPEALSRIGSYPLLTVEEAQKGDEPQLLQIGSVRYTSTRRRARDHGEINVPVQVRVDDFIEMKTAVFGMTRMGKSNTMKTLAVATYRYSKRLGRPIGQLLFDPQGEYANPNAQDDDTALAQLGDDVAIYRFGANTADLEQGVRPLQINFLDEAQLDAAQAVIGSVLSSADPGQYVYDFMGAQIGDPQPDSSGQVSHSATARAARARFCFFGVLAKAGFESGAHHRFSTVMKKELVDAFNAAGGGTRIQSFGAGGRVYVEGSTAVTDVVDWLIREAGGKEDDDGNVDAKKWLDDSNVQAVLGIYNPTGQRRGWRYLRDIRNFHNLAATTDYAHEVYADLVDGKVVIVDLSRGTEQVLQLLSERIINYLLAQATERFTSGSEPHSMQIVIEEAHRLFDRKAYDADSPNPYVRLAKEAAKLKIGLIYATQEVTAVAPAVLANTSNWIVAHLNNTNEIHTLSRYYDFKSFESAILSAEDRGFVRIKTRSGKFIVPVQVSKFDRAMINAARADAELEALPPADGA